jgi:hypothetical protein
LNRDPSGYQGGIDLYGYTQNDAENWCDPSGLNPAALAGVGPIIVRIGITTEISGGAADSTGVGIPVGVIIGVVGVVIIVGGAIWINVSSAAGDGSISKKRIKEVKPDWPEKRVRGCAKGIEKWKRTFGAGGANNVWIDDDGEIYLPPEDEHLGNVEDF